jgi:hypothetical protein
MKINPFNTKVTSQEELDFDNNRLVYVNDLVPVTTHIYEDHTLSTDQVISLFDGGYRFGVLEQIDFVKNQSKIVEERVLVLVEELKKLMYEHDIDGQNSEKFTSELKTIFRDYQSKIESNLVKKFDICHFSNKERVRDEGVKKRNEDFLEQLLKSFGNLGSSRDLF